MQHCTVTSPLLRVSIALRSVLTFNFTILYFPTKLVNQKTYCTEGVENDAFTRSPNLTPASCDLDL